MPTTVSRAAPPRLPDDPAALRALEAELLARLDAVRDALIRASGRLPWDDQVPRWMVQRVRCDRRRRVGVMHRVGCWVSTEAPDLTRAQALEARKHPGVEPCDVCDPDGPLLRGERPRW